MGRRWLKRLCLGFGILFLLFFALSALHYRHYARYQSVEFAYLSHYTYNPYKDGEPMETTDFSRLTYLWNWRASGGTSDEWTRRYGELEPITASPLPQSITYYTREGERFTPAFTLDAGAEVLLFPDGELDRGGRYAGYGFKSWPTYWEGWRYVRPFVSEEDFDPEGEEYYYVKLSDLEKTLAALLTGSSWKDFYQDLTRKQGLGWTILDTVQSYTRNVDYGMYLKQIYFSPDFWHPLWNPALTLFLSLALLSGGGWLFFSLRRKKN